MIYKEGLYKSDLFDVANYTGEVIRSSALYSSSLYGKIYEKSNDIATWDKTYSFDFLAGTTVSLTLTINASIPLSTDIKIYAGEAIDSLVLVPNGVKTQILFTSTTSGITNLYVKVIMTRTSGITPILTSLGLLIEQETSLYTIATSILSDGLTESRNEWVIDTELQKYLIPYAWFTPITHREALGKVAEACGGVAFQDRLGRVIVQAADYGTRTATGTALDTINDDRILNASSPVSDVRNRIQVETRPYIAKAAPEKVWEFYGTETINNGEQKTFDIVFQDYDAVIDCVETLTSTPSGASVVSAEFYSYGAKIVVEGSSDGQVINLSIDGTPLVLTGSELIEKTDGASIRRNGNRVLTIKDNSLIQSNIIATTIAEDILATTKQEARDILLNWRGDPTLELGDEVSVNGQHGVIITNEFIYNGALSSNTQVRKV